jgi:hypothetical protein
MATSEILTFAKGPGAFVQTQAQYAADIQRSIGNQPGIAKGELVNKALLQSSLMASALAKHVAENQENNITDSMTQEELSSAFSSAFGVKSDVAGATSINLNTKFRNEFINPADYNASLVSGSDFTLALRAAMADGRGIVLPGGKNGTSYVMNISDDLPFSTFDQIWHGQGMNTCIIQQTVTGKDVFVRGALASNRVVMNNFWVKTKTGTSRGVWATATAYAIDDSTSADAAGGVLADNRKPYVCLIAHTSTTFAADLAAGRWARAPSAIYLPYRAAEDGIMFVSDLNMMRWSGRGDAMHLGMEFTTTVRGGFASSDSGHAYYIQGGNTSLMQNTYALTCGPDKAGYRSGGGGTFIAPNGINSGGSCFWMGGTQNDIWEAQAISSVFFATLVNPNMEDYTKYGFKGRGQGIATVISGSNRPSLATYIARADLSGTCELRHQGKPRSDVGGTRTADASESAATAHLADYNIATVNSKFSADDDASLLYTTAGINPKTIQTNSLNLTSITLGIAGATVAGANTVSSQCVLKYEGDQVRVSGRLTLTIKDAAMAGQLRITGLPIAASASLPNPGVGLIGRNDSITYGAGRTHLSIGAVTGQTYLLIAKGGSGIGVAFADSADVVSGSVFDFDLLYRP